MFVSYNLLKGLSYSYLNVFGILIFFYVLPLHPYIPKIKNSDGGSTFISDILMQIVISPFSLKILRKLPSFVFFTTKVFRIFFKLSKINLNYIHVKNNPKLTWQANLLFELLPCQLTKICKNCRKDIKHINISFNFLQKIHKML